MIGPNNGKPGRLAAVNGSTKSGCGRSDTTVGGVSINNDVLSCYLTGTNTLAAITNTNDAQVSTSMLDPEIVDSPRFIWIPQVRAVDRSHHDYQPIIRFVPAFITDETATSPAGPSNGVVCNGNGNCNSIAKLVVFTFNPKALQEKDRSPVVDYDETIGRPIPLLID